MYRSINPAAVVETINQLRSRVEERFPGSGLSKVAAELQLIGNQSVGRSAWIGQPQWALRAGIAALIVLPIFIFVSAVVPLHLSARVQSWVEFIQGFESGINSVVLIGAAIFFLFTIEVRIKRHRALKALHELRALAHIIDMHQLTKDPERVRNTGPSTRSSPKRVMTDFELTRYLDYCSEMLSLTGKIAALYVQGFDDPVVLSAVDQIEDLTTSLSRKIWQKITIVNEGRK